MLLRRLPVPPLRPFVSILWATKLADEPSALDRPREWVLPTGAMHLVFRLSSAPLRVFQAHDAPHATTVGHAVVGGARSRAYVRDLSSPSASVGAMLAPGAARILFGASAAAFAERHTCLEELWGRSATRTRERLLELHDPKRRLDLFEAVLLERLVRASAQRGIHPAVAEAIADLGRGIDVRTVVAESGYSHRHFIALFEDAVGLTPKRYGRVLRFDRLLHRLRAGRVPLAQIALEAGYSDQQHMQREFRAIAGFTPRGYQGAAPEEPHHVPLPRGR